MEKNPKKPRKKYECKKCDFSTANRKDYNRHLTTRKHQRITKSNKKTHTYSCECGKVYKFRSGLSKHKKTCNLNLDSTIDIFQKVLEQQQDLQEKMNQAATNSSGNVINYNTNTNNTFSSTSSIEVLTNVRSLIEQGKLDEAEKFLDENKDLLAKSDYLNFKDVKIPNAFFSGSDPLLKSPRFTEFMVLAEKHILNTTGQYNVGDAFNRLFDYKDEALEWLRENPLSKYNNSKLERKKAFEGFLKEQAKGLNLFQTEVTAEQ